MEEIAFSTGAVTYRSGKIFMEETEFELSLKGWIGLGIGIREKVLLVLGLAKKNKVGVGREFW